MASVALPISAVSACHVSTSWSLTGLIYKAGAKYTSPPLAGEDGAKRQETVLPPAHSHRFFLHATKIDHRYVTGDAVAAFRLMLRWTFGLADNAHLART